MPAVQQNIAPTTFGATSTTDDVLEGVNLRGKRVLVTGVSAGLGVETARALVAHGADVVGAARNLTKAKATTVGVQAAAEKGGGLELVELDLAIVQLEDPRDRLYQGRLAGAVVAGQGDDFARMHVERNACERLHAAEMFGRVADGQDGGEITQPGALPETCAASGRPARK